MTPRYMRFWAPLLTILSLVLLWQILTMAFGIRAIVIPRPTLVLQALAADPKFYLTNTWTTVAEAGLGLILGFIGATITASAMAYSQLIERLAWPAIILLQSIPIVVVAPILLIWFGFGLLPKALIVALFVFVPFATNILSGLNSVESDLLNVARSVDASWWEVYRRIQVPNALAEVFAAARICVSLALIGAVISEFYGGSTNGLGFQFRRSLANLDPGVAWSCIVILSSLGMLATFAMLALERRMLYWHPSYRKE